MTIPPPAFTSIAHVHGVQVLGTLIFEWDQGAKEARMLLNGEIGMDPISIRLNAKDAINGSKKSDEGNRFYAKKLA